jgi:hypothetical protein
MRGRGAPRTVVLAVAILAALGGAAAHAAPTAPLSHSGRWITDRDGRVVILHGWNMVYKVGSSRPADAGFGADDARFLARHGFNTVRLGMIHKGLGSPRRRARTDGLATGRGYLDSIDGGPGARPRERRVATR